jgi:hypothetical protein
VRVYVCEREKSINVYIYIHTRDMMFCFYNRDIDTERKSTKVCKKDR